MYSEPCKLKYTDEVLYRGGHISLSHIRLKAYNITDKILAIVRKMTNHLIP